MVTRKQKLSEINSENIIRFESYGINNKNPLVPEYTGFWAACFSFSIGEFVKKIPYPKNTPYLFFGEEMLMSIRSFTHGWDLRAPRYNILYHLWKRDYRKTFQANEKIRLQSIKKIQKIIYGDYVSGYIKPLFINLSEKEIILNNDMEIGNKRSREHYFKYIGIKIENNKNAGAEKFQIKPINPNFKSYHWKPNSSFTDLNDEFVEHTIYNDVKILKNKKIHNIFFSY